MNIIIHRYKGMCDGLIVRQELLESEVSDEVVQAPVIYHGGVCTMDEMPEIFRKSKINLNPTMRFIKSGTPAAILGHSRMRRLHPYQLSAGASVKSGGWNAP